MARKLNRGITLPAVAWKMLKEVLNSGVAVASSGNQYFSSRARFSGFGWATTPAASQQVDAIIELRPVQGAANPTSLFAIATQINGGGYTDRLTMTNAGDTVISLNATALAAETEFPGQLGLQIAGVDGSVVRFLVDAFGGVPAMYFRSAGGTNAAKTALASGVGMFSVAAGGYYGAGYAPAKILIGGFAAEAWDSTHTGAYFGFYTTPLGTAQGTSATEVMRLQASGGLTLGHSIITTDPGLGGLALQGLVKTYNNIATAGWGVPAIQAAGRATAQTAANASISTYTVGAADGSFEVSANVLVTTSTTHTFTVTCAYHDEGNTLRTLTFGFTQLAGATFLTSITNITGAGPYESPVYHIRCKAGSAITIATTGTFTTVTYNVEGIIRQVA
jgi:hypothetical protein